MDRWARTRRLMLSMVVVGMMILIVIVARTQYVDGALCHGKLTDAQGLRGGASLCV